MEIEKIISLIKNLNNSELKQLISYLNEEDDLGQFNNETELTINLMKNNPPALTNYLNSNYGNLIEELKSLLEEYFGAEIGVNYTWEGSEEWFIGDIDFYFIDKEKAPANMFPSSNSGNKSLKVCAVLNGASDENVEAPGLKEGETISHFYLVNPQSKEGEPFYLVKKFVKKEDFSWGQLIKDAISAMEKKIYKEKNTIKIKRFT